jgi:hypothetical protein
MKSGVDVDIVRILIFQRKYREALTAIQSLPGGEDRDQALALIHHAFDQDTAADAAIRRLTAAGGPGSAVRLAEIYANREDFDEAFKWINTAYDRLRPDVWLYAEWIWVYQLHFSPFLNSLRADPRWQPLSVRGAPPGSEFVLDELPEQFAVKAHG